MKTLFKEPKRRLRDGRYCSEEQKRIELSIERCKLLEMKLNATERKAQALAERNVQLEMKLDRITKVLKELC